MKYNQPYGVSDPNAPYINGNPTTGTMGSIPPAASIEYPQREIVNFVTDSTLTPDNANLRQLSQSVQNGAVNYSLDQGTPNFVAITPVPPITAYVLGQHFRIKMSSANTGPTKINISNIGFAPLVRGDKSDVGSGELLVGQMIDVAWDGTNWQMMTGSFGGLIMMTAPSTFYVNVNTGDDTLYDGTQATVDAPHGHGPYKSLQKALSTMLKYNLGGWTFAIIMADGTYTFTAPFLITEPNGSGLVTITGNTTAQNVRLLQSVPGPCLLFSGGRYSLDGLYVQTTGISPATGGTGIRVDGSADVSLNKIWFGPCAECHVSTGYGASLSMYGPFNIEGGAQVHVAAGSNGIMTFSANPFVTLNVDVPCTFTTAFAQAVTGGQLGIVYGTINNPGNVTGQKYLAVGNGVINTLGRGTSYLPGTVAGATSSGGQYL